MFGGWAAIGAVAVAVGAQAPQVPAQSPGVLLDEQIRIVGSQTYQNLVTGVSRFSNGVTVYYGPTKITAESVVADRGKQTASASGNVIITDPEGTIQATDIELNWAEGSRRATAQNVRIELAGARLRAKSAVLTDTLWVFENIEGTTCGQNTPFYSIRSPRFEIVPGKSGTLVKPVVSLFGRKLLTLPSQRFNLDPRVQGIRPPNIAYRKDQGIGIAWNGQFLIDSQTAGAFDLGAFRGGYPNYSLGISRSFVSSEKTKAFITPRDDLGDRFNVGYFDSIELNSPNAGFRNLSNPRSTLAVSTQFNRGAVIGPSELSYSRPLDIAYELGGKSGSIGTIGQIRAQNIRAQGYPSVNRISMGGTAITDVLPVGKRLGVVGSIDAQSFLSQNQYGWARASAGLVYEPISQLRLGAATFLGKEFGESDFPADELYAKSGYALRADLTLGGLRARYMLKYDTQRKWYDREYSINQAIGCIEAFVLYRQYPQTYLVGVKLRVDQFVDLLQRKKFERTKPVPMKKTVISGG
ncbi:hypothetical protein EON81_05850 [bacterium]|nr:MAG: hypothetical protein EON81_05850 [bacterium]